MPNMANHVESLQCLDSGCGAVKIQHDAEEEAMKIVTRQTVYLCSTGRNFEPVLLVASDWNLKL